MGERFTYLFIAVAAFVVVACGPGDSGDPDPADAAGRVAGVDPAAELPHAPLPSAPRIVRVTPGDGYATVEWDSPGSESDATSFLVTGAPDGSRSVSGDVFSARINGLANGEEYTFVVRGVNESGFGPDSDVSRPVLIASAPGAPPAIAATELSEGGVRLAWFAPARDGGSEITTYVLNSESEGAMRVLLGDPTAGYALPDEPGVSTRPGPAESGSLVYVIEINQPLALDRFRVAAANQVGLGQWSDWALVEPAIVPASDNEIENAPAIEASPAAALPEESETGPIPAGTPEPSETIPGESEPSPDVGEGTPVPLPTPAPPVPPGAPTPEPSSAPGATITVKWLPTLYGAGGPPPGWQPTLIGTAGQPFLLHSIETWSTDPVDVFRADVDWGDGTSDQAWFEDPVYISSRTANGIAKLFAYHTYAAPGRYTVTITVSAINHSGVMGETTIEALIDQ